MNLPRPEIWRRPLVATAVLVLLAGCADMGSQRPSAQLKDDAVALGLNSAASAPAAPTVDSRWWLAFGDAQLDALVAQALADNPNLRSAQARMARAQAATDVAAAAGRPQLNAELDLTRSKFSENYIYPAPLGGSIQNMGTGQFNGSWEIDFFGKNRSALEAALGVARAASADAEAARVLLAANVARSYVQWARLQAQLAVAQRTLAQREETLGLVRDRVSAGLDTRLELHQSEGGLPEARQQIEALQEQMALVRHALDALVGQPNRTAALVPPTLTALQAMTIDAVLPADLLGRRADIVAARWRVEAAQQNVANAKSQFYPNVNLVGFAGLQSIGFNELLRGSSLEWGIGPAVKLPIFDGGRLRANLRGKAAERDDAIESYNAAVLDAVRDAADQISSAQSIGRQQSAQRAAQAAAESAYDIAVQRYRAGLGNYLQVLTAETTVLLQRRQAVDLAARALEIQIALARALGGGWQGDGPTAAAPTRTPS